MPTTEQLIDELKSQKAELLKARTEAAGKPEALKKIDEAIEEVDSARVGLALGMLSDVAANIGALRAKIEVATRKASTWPFGSLEAPERHEVPFRAELQDNDAFDAGPHKPAPKPATVPSEKVPKVTHSWSENYKKLWQTMIIRPEWQKTADAIAKKIIARQSRYAAGVAGTQVPWWFIAVVHAMECSLRFDQHIHNGDPLTARTVRVPRGRPPAGAPPFTWEESVRNSIAYEKLDKVDDWSLPSVLFHWHRYNGINNEYKRRGIPTPYLWSGSQHYRKGKYVKDGVFDPEAVSAQTGAAVILKAMIELGAVELDRSSRSRPIPLRRPGIRLRLTSTSPAEASRTLPLNLTTRGFSPMDQKMRPGKSAASDACRSGSISINVLRRLMVALVTRPKNSLRNSKAKWADNRAVSSTRRPGLCSLPPCGAL